jgi:hypothetical protein
VQTIEASFPWEDSGVRCIDSDSVIHYNETTRQGSSTSWKLHPHVTTVVTGHVDVDNGGTYKVTYDSGFGTHLHPHCELPPQLIRTVVVQDTLKPVIAVHYRQVELTNAFKKLEAASPHGLIDTAAAVLALKPHKDRSVAAVTAMEDAESVEASTQRGLMEEPGTQLSTLLPCAVVAFLVVGAAMRQHFPQQALVPHV